MPQYQCFPTISLFTMISSVMLTTMISYSIKSAVAEHYALCFPLIAQANEACNRYEFQLPTSPAAPPSVDRNERDDTVLVRDSLCCERLQNINETCICEALNRLPSFMSTVPHTIILSPTPICNIWFYCPGNITSITWCMLHHHLVYDFYSIVECKSRNIRYICFMLEANKAYPNLKQICFLALK